MCGGAAVDGGTGDCCSTATAENVEKAALLNTAASMARRRR